jgi:hypothetical protein
MILLYLGLRPKSPAKQLVPVGMARGRLSDDWARLDMYVSQIQPQIDYVLDSPDTGEIRWPSPSPVKAPEISNGKQLSFPDQELELIQARPLLTSPPENSHCPACCRTGYQIIQDVVELAAEHLAVCVAVIVRIVVSDPFVLRTLLLAR